MQLDLVPRINGVAADVDQTSVVELYKIHVQSLKESKMIEKEASMPRSSRSIVKAHRHLLLSVKTFLCNTEDNLEVYFSLYDGEGEKFVSERFMMYLDKEALPDVAETLSSEKTKTLFTDLGRKTFATDLFIVCHVIRTGQMHSESPRRKNSPNCRRPFACGVLNVQEHIALEDDFFGEDRPFFVSLFPCTNEANFHNMHEELIRKFVNKSSTSATDGLGMSVSLKVFNGDRDRIISANPLWMPADICITRKLGFPEVILPGDIRNDVFITLNKGEFEKGGKAAGRNIEVTVSVLLTNGTVVENCVHAGSGSRGSNEYNSLILYHSNNPNWNETFKLNIPIDKFQDSHVLFVLKHCSTTSHGKKVFGFAFLRPLRDDGTTILNGIHQLIFYKPSALDSKNPVKYLAYPSSVADLSWVKNQDSLNHSARSTKETFFVSTLTCSTKITQNLDLVGLLRWRQHKHKISEVLDSLVRVRGDEIMKFLQDILDALFAILNEDIEKSGLSVFKNLIFIINLLLDSKYQQFQAVLNTYISQHFSAALAHRHIVVLFKKVMSKEKSKYESDVVKVAKALHYIIKFVMQSWALNIRTHPEKSNFEFKGSVREFFVVLNKVMEKIGDGWRGAQSAILLNLPKVYQDLSTVFTDDELAEILKDLFCSARSSSLITDKLNFLDGLITTSPLFHNESSRVTLMPLVLNCLHQQLLQKNELKTCADILGNFLSCLSKVKNGSVHSEIEEISGSLLEVVFQAVVTVDRTSPRAGKYVAILYTLLKMMNEDNYQSYMKSFENQKDLRDFLNKAFGVFTNLLQRNIYADDWFVMKIEGNYVILGAVQNFSQALTDNFLLEDAFDYQLWSTYFHLAISFVSHEILDVQKYSEAKRTKILEKYGDMRHVMGNELVRMWNCLGDLQSHFIPSMIEPFLEMTLVSEPVLRQETLPLFCDMMHQEMKNSGNITKVEEEFIDKLDVFLSRDGKGDKEYKELFEKILTEKVTRIRELREPGVLFVNSVVQLLERLLDYRKVVSSREEHRDMKMGCIVNLLNYYEEKGKEEMFLRYVRKLYELHLSAENYIEAGFTLYLYASCLEFEDYPLPAEDDFPAQTERARKEMLCKKSIDLLDRGKLWESAIRICKTLIHEYENETFDFIKIKDMLQRQAEFYENIVNTHRVEPSYFRVGFYGKGFPSFLQNKQFVYRGRPVEKIGEFCFRIQSEYPDAEVLRHNNPLDEELMLSNKQYIQCCKVEPILSGHSIQSIPNYVNYRISSYYDVNWVDTFTLARPFHKGEQIDKSNEFATLWCEITTLTIEARLPGILPWFPVISSKRRELSPIENAINTVTSKTRELQRSVDEIQEDKKSNINPLSMQLKGVIDAAVNGGVSNYQRAFFTPDYTRTNPQRKTEVDHLEKALLKQAGVLRRGMILHESRISPDLRPLHESMLRQYNDMLNNLPGDTQQYVLIQRKWSLPPSVSPSESTTSLDKRTTTDSSDTGTLRKLSLLFSSRKPILSVFSSETDGPSRQSAISEVMLKQSSSLLSISEMQGVSQSASVPDLRSMDETRPKLPQKLRTGKQWNEDSGSPAKNRVSASSSLSATSLNEINELDESELALNDAAAPSLKIDRRELSRTPSPEIKSKPVSVSPRIPPKKRSTVISTAQRKRQSNIFELSSEGSYRISKGFSKLQSRSMDDLDKIGDSPLGEKGDASQGTHSEENLFSGKLMDEKQKMKKDSNDNMNIRDEETPPPLFPRKKTTRLDSRSQDGYDFLAIPPNVALRSTSRENTYNTVKFTPRTSSSHAQNGQKIEGNKKHRYANLDGGITLPQHNSPHPNTDAYEPDPYDVLALPSRTNHSDRKDGASDGNEWNLGLELSHPDAVTAYDNVVLCKTPDVNYDKPHLRDFPGQTDQANGTSNVYEHHVPRRLSGGHTLNTTYDNIANAVPNTVVSQNASQKDPPMLPPKAHHRDNTVPPKQQETFPSLRSSSPGLTQQGRKYSPPVAPRIKKPPRTLSKPNNVETE
ncbi:dedicator of cytokinesis protein 3-like [Dendronephthya gigantea]|uniref:dedicator of cytokinesis protein 3-like n=1 Tax=Dendronephthya gigantea TaxID=151771 RepID=UPI00106AA206|nr:dedicator of cytokinesis protein 3-like [Dendronephthya gigantea]